VDTELCSSILVIRDGLQASPKILDAKTDLANGPYIVCEMLFERLLLR
jgi:hypothetical protein